jgi:ParB-like nuclease domain
MSKKLTIDFSQNTSRIPASMKQRVIIGERVENIEVGLLTANTLNAQVFKRESAEYFKNLRDDIRKRGVIVPLLAKRDNTLLAGHNRLEIAKEIGLKYVPVQYVQDELSEDAEREFLIKDNLFRRQFSSEEWIDIYRQLVANYDAIIARDGRGGDTKSERATTKKIKKDTVLFDFETATQEDVINYLHQETGAPIETIRKRIQRDKKRQKEQPNTKKQQEVAETNEIDTSIIKKIEKDLIAADMANEATRKEVMKRLKAFVKKG